MGKESPLEPSQPKLIIEYENEDIRPTYVEGAQGARTPQGALYVSFYSEFVKTQKKIQATVKKTDDSDDSKDGTALVAQDPFMFDNGELHIVRRVEANLIFTVPSLESLIPWLTGKLQEMKGANESVQPD